MGQILRTMFLVEYISDRSLRQEITACTHNVENYSDRK
ncbi:Tn3 family transposase [Microcoleus sp. Pol7_A1]